MADVLIALGGNVGDVRATFGKAIANICGMTQAALSQIESGEHKARKATREKLARAMGITAEQLK